MIQSKNYPLKLAKDIESLLREVRKIEFENSDVVRFSEYDTHQTILRDLDYSDKFYFAIVGPNQESSNKTSMFQFRFCPHHADTLEDATGNAKADAIINLLNKWINLIREFNQIKYNEEDNVSAFYEKEFYDEYEIVEEDADIHPFDSNKQEILYQRLLEFRQTLEQHEEIPEAQEIINDTNVIIDNLTTSSQKKIVRQLSKLYAKFKKIGMPAIKAFGKEAFTQLIKYGVTDIMRHLLP